MDSILDCKWNLYDIKINYFELQLITNEIYMTTKLTVAPWKWDNDLCKTEKRKRKRVFHFSFLVFGWTRKWPHFCPLPWIQTAPTMKQTFPLGHFYMLYKCKTRHKNKGYIFVGFKIFNITPLFLFLLVIYCHHLPRSCIDS